METILTTNNLGRKYPTGETELQVLKGVSFEVLKGESLAIVGPSGSGKTTLLGLCAGLDIPSEGSVGLAGQNLNEMSEEERAVLRRNSVGFIFQNFQLLPTLSALENVMIPLELSAKKNAAIIAKEWLEKVGLGDRIHHYPLQLSGGEQQRVSIARAFSNSPAIVFADEPTGNLDKETGDKIRDLIFSINREQNTTLILVTHDLSLADHCKKIIEMEGGKMVSLKDGKKDFVDEK